MRVVSTIFLVLIFCSHAGAEAVDISSNLRLYFTVPDGWVSDSDPPQFLVEEMAEHIEHDAESKGQHPTSEQLQRAARQRFKDNEVLVYNPRTHSFMTLDFSRLRQGERPPSQNSIELSARYAGESLGNEEGVSKLSTRTSSANVAGAWYAHRLDASYRHHDKPMVFVGIVGFSTPFWFYFYYTDYQADDRDRDSAEMLLKSIRLENR